MRNFVRNPYLSSFEVARMFQITVDNLYAKLSRGVFPKEVFFKLGRRVYFHPDKLNSWLESGGTVEGV